MKNLLKASYTLFKIAGAVLWFAGLGIAMEEKHAEQMKAKQN